MKNEKNIFNVERERAELGIVATATNRGRPKNKVIVRDNSVQAGLDESDFYCSRCSSSKVEGFCYTERIPIKDALDVALESFLKDAHDLLSHDRKNRDGEILRIDGENTYNLREVSAILNRSVLTVRNYIRLGKLQATKIGNSYFITESALKKFAKAYEIAV